MSAGSPGEDEEADRGTDDGAAGRGDRDAAGPDDAVGEDEASEGADGEEPIPDAEADVANAEDSDVEEVEDFVREAEVADLRARIDTLRGDLESFEVDVEERTVHRSEIESELRRYVRARVRRGHARGWGPYLVLLYGTAMTIGAFYLLSGGWAILAMIVIWLSTLGLYALMLIVGAILGVASVPGRAVGWVRERRR